VQEMCSYTVVSQRQLERLFLDYVGTTPKKISNLVRYQNVLYDLIYSNEFQVQDMVDKYKFTDQSHLLNEFKKYHSMTLKQAKNFASVLK
jgi:AraC-like DNA-binding protein